MHDKIKSNNAILSLILLAVSAAIGICWWLLLWSNAAFPVMRTRGVMVYFIAFVGVQLIGWVVTAVVARRAMLKESAWLPAVSIGISILMLIGNGLYLFTPVVGVPFLILGIGLGLISWVASVIRRNGVSFA